MRVLVLGGTGVISREIVAKAADMGHDVTVFNRGTQNINIPTAVKVVIGDRNNVLDFETKMNAVSVDVVIDMISFNTRDAKQILDLFGERAKQIIITSSSSVYERPYKTYPVTEDTVSLTMDSSFDYSFNKAEMDRYLQKEMGKHSAAITIIRPSLTFGEGTANLGTFRQNRNIVRRIKEGKPVVMIGEGVIPWSFTFAPDLAKGYVLACGNENTYDNHFHITNDEVVVWEDIYRAIGEIVGKEPNFVYIPTVLLRKMYPSVCTHLNYEKVHFAVFSNAKIQNAIKEYKPQISLVEGMRKLINWWEKVDFPYDDEKDDIEDAVCKAYYDFEKALLDLNLQ